MQNCILTLNNNEKKKINEIFDSLKGQFEDYQCVEFLKVVRIYSNKLPDRLVQFINDLKYDDGGHGYRLVRGIKYRDITPTPMSLENSEGSNRTSDSDLFLILSSSILGEIFGWSLQRKGDLINDIFPLKQNEKEQLSTGSKEQLELHTEEAFHPYRADYLGLTCIRNNEGAATILSSVNDVQISNRDKKILSEKRFFFDTDKNFSKKGFVSVREAVLFGSQETPYLRIDPVFMRTENEDLKSINALNKIISELNRHSFKLILQSGDICFIDNYTMVHGRAPFSPDYNGKGRWLKRVNIACDLRKSRKLRSHSNSHVIINE